MVSISNLLKGGLLLVDQLIYSDVAVHQQASIEQFNIIRYLGGSGPYIQHPGYGISNEIPEKCELQQVQLFARHGERFPTIKTGKKFERIYAKLRAYPNPFKGELEFLNNINYKYFVEDPEMYEMETSSSNSEGDFAGTEDSYRHGRRFRERYGSLYNDSQVLPVFSSNSNRCFTTGKYFSQGFFGDDYSEEKVKYYILAEASDLGANSLTPRKSCSSYVKNENEQLVDKYDDSYLQEALERFQQSNPALQLSKRDISTLFKYCAYELNVKGISPMCGIFTNDEYVKWSYGKSLSKYYSIGPGHSLSKVIGSTLLNASRTLLGQDNENKIYVSFTHDTDLEMYLAALGLLQPDHLLSVDEVEFPNPYVHSALLPQGARIYTEKYQCSGEIYVRYIVNDAVIPIPGCSAGPGFSCKLDEFTAYINMRLETVNYASQCQLHEGLPSEVTFYWDYLSRNYTAPLVNN